MDGGISHLAAPLSLPPERQRPPEKFFYCQHMASYLLNCWPTVLDSLPVMSTDCSAGAYSQAFACGAARRGSRFFDLTLPRSMGAGLATA